MSEVTGTDMIRVEDVTSLVPETTEAKQFDTGAVTNFSTMEQVKNDAPEVYKAMMEGIAQNILSDLRDHQERMRELIKEARRDSGEA